MLRKLCIGVALVAVSMGCGGGGSDGGDPPATPTITVGTTVVAVGESKTIHASVDETLTIVASEVVPGLTLSHCTDLSFPKGIQTGVDTYTIKIGANTTECTLKVSFSEGDATLTIQVP